jgi:hypothetical protein
MEHQPPDENIEYVPPTLETITHVAQAVCKQLAQRHPPLNRAEVVHGVAAFLNVVTRMHAKHMNTCKSAPESDLLDRESQEG